jgi:hypothetical protein
VATQSGYLETNMPQTGHLSLMAGDGADSGAADAAEQSNRRQNRKIDVMCSKRIIGLFLCRLE